MRSLSPLEPVAGDREEVLGRYRHLPWTGRLFLWIRWHWTPYREMAALLPEKGLLLDAGCGHGLLSLALALGHPRRRVLGIDHEGKRVAAASWAALGLPNLAFKRGDYASLPDGPYLGMALVDVLHYLPPAQQERVLKRAFRKLKKGGKLIFREVDRRPGPLSYFNRFHEKVMTGLGFTKAEGLFFRDPDDWKRIAEEAGFTVTSYPFSRFPFADILFECRKP